jgi:hypothetical protein
MVVNIAVLVLSVIAVVLLLIANLGTTFDSTFLPKIYLVQINEAVNGRAIRYGIYRSCLYFDTAKAAVSCTVSKPGYTFGKFQEIRKKMIYR